jgi:predicted secreted Zn-dependent protease
MPIRKTKGGWKVNNTPGTSKTKKAAKRRLRAIKWRQGKARRNKRRRNQ